MQGEMECVTCLASWVTKRPGTAETYRAGIEWDFVLRPACSTLEQTLAIIPVVGPPAQC